MTHGLAPGPLVRGEPFWAMGTRAEVQIGDGDPGLLDEARDRLEELEARWSRFRPYSDVSTLNRLSGLPVRVAPETVMLVERSMDAARATEGRFDPTVGRALASHGYDRDFARVPGAASRVVPLPVVDGSWPAIEIDHEANTVCLPPGSTFDPGGIGKGLAADLVAEELAHRAASVLVNVGGDIRMCGTAPSPDGWVVSIEDPFCPEQDLTRLSLPQGAVATSSRLRRRWETADGPAHHIIDPCTGRPATTEVVAVTAMAAEAWWAEAQATSLFLLGPEGLAEAGSSVHAVMVFEDGCCRATPGCVAMVQ